MIRRFVTTAIAVLLLATSAWADTLLVPEQHRTIQTAIEAAEDGDVISIRAGRYGQDVTISGMTNLTLVGRGPVTIMAADRGLLAENSTGLTLSKLRFDNGFICVQIRNCEDVLLEKFQVKNAVRDGVFVMGSTNVRIEKGKVKDCTNDGVSLADGNPDDPVTFSSVTKVNVSGCGGDGIVVLGSNVTVSKCQVRDCGDDSFESSIDGAGQVGFSKCKSRNAGDEGFELYSRGSIAEFCSDSRAGDDSFDVQGEVSAVTNCRSTRPSGDGITLAFTEGSGALECVVTRAGGTGISLVSADECLVQDCKIQSSGANGVFIDGVSNDNTVRDTKAKNSGEFDLDDEGSGTVRVGNNQFGTIDPNE